MLSSISKTPATVAQSGLTPVAHDPITTSLTRFISIYYIIFWDKRQGCSRVFFFDKIQGYYAPLCQLPPCKPTKIRLKVRYVLGQKQDSCPLPPKIGFFTHELHLEYGSFPHQHPHLSTCPRRPAQTVLFSCCDILSKFPPIFYHFPRRGGVRPQKTSMQIAGAFLKVEKPSYRLHGRFRRLKSALAKCRGVFQGRKTLLQNAWAFSKPG